MTKVLAIRTADGYYFEFRTIRVRTEEGQEIEVDFDTATLAEVFDVQRAQDPPEPIVISGAGGIHSHERVHGS